MSTPSRLAIVPFVSVDKMMTLVLTVGALTGQTSWQQLGVVWGWSYLGNLIGSVALAWLIAQ